MPNVQQKTINSTTTTVTLTGAPGPITLDGAFDGGTITETLPGSTVAIDTFTAITDNHFFFNGNDITFTMAGAGGSESVVIRWFRANKPY